MAGMLNFTVGPVVSCPEVLKIASMSAPYFRTSEFSDIMFQNEKLILKFLNAPDDSRCVFLTTSGTGAMESCVMNILNNQDKVIVINGGSFGQRLLNFVNSMDITWLRLNVNLDTRSGKNSYMHLRVKVTQHFL